MAKFGKWNDINIDDSLDFTNDVELYIEENGEYIGDFIDRPNAIDIIRHLIQLFDLKPEEIKIIGQ